MTQKARNVDAVFREVARLNEIFFKERDARLEANRAKLKAIYGKYKKKRTGKIKNPDADALFLFFREAFVKKNFAEIVKVGNLIEDEMWYWEHGEIQAYYLYAKKQTQN